jgi:hypothetical protein
MVGISQKAYQVIGNSCTGTILFQDAGCFSVTSTLYYYHSDEDWQEFNSRITSSVDFILQFCSSVNRHPDFGGVVLENPFNPLSCLTAAQMAIAMSGRCVSCGLGLN